MKAHSHASSAYLTTFVNGVSAVLIIWHVVMYVQRGIDYISVVTSTSWVVFLLSHWLNWLFQDSVSPTVYSQYMCFVFQGFTVMRTWRPSTCFLSSRRRSLFSQVRHFTLRHFSQHARKSLLIHSVLMVAFVVSLYFCAGIITFWVNIMTFSSFGNIGTASKPKTKCNRGFYLHFLKIKHVGWMMCIFFFIKKMMTGFHFAPFSCGRPNFALLLFFFFQRIPVGI